MKRDVNMIAVVAAVVAVTALGFLLSEGRWLGPVVALAAALLAVFAARREAPASCTDRRR